MFKKLITSFLGSRNERLLKQMYKQVDKINALESTISALTDAELRGKTDEFKQRLAAGAKLDDLLVEAFAVVREAAKRQLGMRHFDVQLIGGMVLNSGKIAEMRTGEGKTLTETLPAYLNALSGKGVHIITVNDYLATRDADWMRPVFEFLGMNVGVIHTNQEYAEKQAAYACDITYGTNNEFGFDYLRDNMAFSKEEKVQRELNFAVVDEVDSILIDEARTPLIISGAAEDSSSLYRSINKLVPQLKRKMGEEDSGDYELDEKTKQVHISEEGHQHLEELLAKEGLLKEGESLYDLANISLMHHVSAALRAHAAFHKDVDYIVQNGDVVIVDEHTGRTMPGRRWSDGLHQAMEAKEGVNIQNENMTMASITFQNYFRLYNKLSGMTGTADTEAFEFQQIYGLEVVIIPTNKPMIRKDHGDQIYLTAKEKYDAIIKDVEQRRENGQPTLVGTASIEASEYLSKLMDKAKIPHSVLNAKFHEKEAEIIAQAGKPGAVTIATNMAGRGTDIMLGGNVNVEIAALENPTSEKIAALKAEWQKRHDAVLAAGGLHIIGSERHESRRIDNQLRGRAGRQGDAGSSRFYLSLEDNLMRIFASDRMGMLMKRLGMKEGESIEHKWVSKAVENAQRKVEGHNFDIRKQLLEYDDVANDQRRVIYAQREELMNANDVSATVRKILADVIDATFEKYIPTDSLEEQWDITGLEKQLKEDFAMDLAINQWLEEDDELHADTLKQRVSDAIFAAFDAKEQQVGAEVMRHFEKAMMLQSLDSHWREHLASMDHLRQGIGLRGYAQKNPKQEYKREAFLMFNDMLTGIKEELAGNLIKVQFVAEADVEAMEQKRRQATPTNLQFNHAELESLEGNEAEAIHDEHTPFVRMDKKVGRNEPCPCGSGKKYKQCHGTI
jgi:preprotein translocase subunit SecA